MQKKSNYNVVEKNLGYEDLRNADEAFFTGTAVEITPITKIDDHKIKNGKRGNVTKKLQEKFNKIICGDDKTYEDWLSFVK